MATSPLASRDYEAGSDYFLPRDKAEEERLNNQHKYLTILLFEGRLIYDSSVVLAPGSRVLDAGTGTGIWLQELARQVPASVALVGCDVSTNNFPAQHAPNVRFVVASVTALPASWAGTFDFVNQRLLFGGLRAAEWPATMGELLRVLRPGGRVQLMEMDLAHLVNPGPATRRIMRVYAELYARAGLLLEGSSRLEGLLKDAGFDEVRSEKKYLVTGKAWGRMGELGTQNYLNIFRNSAATLLKYGLIGSIQEHDVLTRDCIEEWNSAEEGYRYIAHVAVARKPQNMS